MHMIDDAFQNYLTNKNHSKKCLFFELSKKVKVLNRRVMFSTIVCDAHSFNVLVVSLILEFNER